LTFLLEVVTVGDDPVLHSFCQVKMLKNETAKVHCSLPPSVVVCSIHLGIGWYKMQKVNSCIKMNLHVIVTY